MEQASHGLTDLRLTIAGTEKTDRNDARGIAQMMRVGVYRPVHLKTLRSQKLRMLLTHRKLLQCKAIAIDNDLRGTLRNFDLKVGMVGTAMAYMQVAKVSANSRCAACSAFARGSGMPSAARPTGQSLGVGRHRECTTRRC